jgi:hypothetical protein
MGSAGGINRAYEKARDTRGLLVSL